MSACTKLAGDCNSFEGDALELIEKHFPDVFGKVCVESSGDQCLRTNVVYTTCTKSLGKIHEYSVRARVHLTDKVN